MTGNWTRLLCVALALVCAYGESKSCPIPNNSNTLLRDDILQCSKGFHVNEIGIVDEHNNGVTLYAEHIPLSTATCESNGWTIDGFFLSGVQLTSFVCVPTPGLDSTTTTTTTSTTTVPTTTTTVPHVCPTPVPPPPVTGTDDCKDCESRNCADPYWRIDQLRRISRTCYFELNPNADCAIYTQATNFVTYASLDRKAYNRFPGICSTGAVGGRNVTFLWARTGCTVTLFADLAGTEKIEEFHGNIWHGYGRGGWKLQEKHWRAQSFSITCDQPTPAPTTVTCPPEVPPPPLSGSDYDDKMKLHDDTFCARHFTRVVKQYYSRTCTFELNPNSDCAIHTQIGEHQDISASSVPSQVVRTAYNSFNGTCSIPSVGVNGRYVVSVWARYGCTVKLYSDLAETNKLIEFQGREKTGEEDRFGVWLVKEHRIGQSFSCQCSGEHINAEAPATTITEAPTTTTTVRTTTTTYTTTTTTTRPPPPPPLPCVDNFYGGCEFMQKSSCYDQSNRAWLYDRCRKYCNMC